MVQVGGVELLILSESHGRKAHPVGGDDVPPEQLVPHHGEVKAGGLADDPPQIVGFCVDPGGQQAVFPGVIAAAVRDHHPVRGQHQHGLVPPGGGNEALGAAGQQVIVAVGKLDVFAPGKGQPLVAGVRSAGVGLVDEADAGIRGRQLPADGQGVVLRAVIEQRISRFG